MAVPQLRPYQSEAVEAIVAALVDGGSGQLYAACGSGKTLMAMRAAEQLIEPDGLVVVLAPSLALVAQILRNWREDSTIDFRRFAVCSDSTVGGEDDAMRVADLGVPVSTDRDDIAKMIASEGPRLIVGTYLSASRLADAVCEADAEIDLLACDEAHHLAGNADAHTRRIMDPAVLHARRRLYMTGTPRIGRGRDDEQHDTRTLSMDDEAAFGPVLYSYPFSRGIAEGHLADYRIAVIGVTDQEVRDLLRREDVEYADGIGLSTAAAQVALARAYRDFGLRRAITFHGTIDDAQRFSATLPGTLATLPDASRSPAPTSLHVNGTMDGERRREVLDALANPPDGGWSVASNVRCLSEGVDVPALDGVLFGNPKKSTVDIVQAASRALRPHPDTPGLSTIIVPVIVPDPGDEVESFDPGAYEALFQILRALKDHDDVLAAEMNAARANLAAVPAGTAVGVDSSLDRDGEDLAGVDPDAPDGGVSGPDGAAGPVGERLGAWDSKVEFHGISPKFLAELRLVVLRRTTSEWWEGYAEARAYHKLHGHLDVPWDYVTPSGFRLGGWLPRQRGARRGYGGCLTADRVRALDELAIDWEPFGSRWRRGFQLAREFNAANGHLDVPSDYIVDGFALGAWIGTNRQNFRVGMLSASRQKDLDAVGMIWDVSENRWAYAYNLAAAFKEQHGHLNIPKQYITEGFALGAWLGTRRQDYKQNALSDERAEALEALGISWESHLDSKWQEGYETAREYQLEHGDLLVPPQAVFNGYRLGGWVSKQRQKYRRGVLSAARKEQLDRLGMVWGARDYQWDSGLSAARAFHAEHGHLRVPRGHVDGMRLGRWIAKHRRDLKAGTLSAERKRALDELGVDWNPYGNRKALDA